MSKRKYDDEYFVNQQNQVYGDPYSNETHIHYPSRANRSNAMSKKRKMPQNNMVEIHTGIYDSDKIQNGIEKDKQKYLLTKNPGFKLIVKGDNQEDTHIYKIVLGNDGNKIWEESAFGGKRRTRSSRKKRTLRKQRK